MKKLLFILFIVFLTSVVRLFAQDVSPLPSVTIKKLIAPNNPTFYYNPVDSSLWMFKGETGWLRIATNSQLQKYYVPYTGAIKDLNLGTHSILAEGQQLPLSNGGCQISSLTDNGNGSITIGTGDYHLSANVSGKGSHNYTLTGGTFTLTDQSQNYIVADYNSGSPYIHVITDVTLINETTIVPIYSVFRNGNILHIQNWDALGIALANKIHQSIVKTQRYRRESGLAVSEYGTHNLNLATGRIWTGAVPITLDAIATATDNLFFFRHVAGVWTPSIQTTYNFTKYDNGTNLVDLTANRYAVNWIFRGVESQKHLYIVAGTGDYTEAQATAATLPAIPVAISSHAVLVAKLIVQKNAATALSIQSAFDVQFGLSAIQSHGDLTGRDAIDSHPLGAITNTPYSTTSATNGQLAINELTDEKENLSNKENTTVDNSTTKYPTVNLLKTYADTKAPASGSVNYIQNQNSSAQAANAWINGNFAIGSVNDSKLRVTNTDVGLSLIRAVGVNGSMLIDNVGSGRNYFNALYEHQFQINGIDRFHLNELGEATFGATVNSTGYKLNNIDLFGSLSANTITKWDGTKLVNYDKSTGTLSGTNVTWDYSVKKNYKITLTGNTVITITNISDGDSGTLYVTNATPVYTITFAGYVNSIDPYIRLASNMVITSGGGGKDDFTFKYNGTYLTWHGALDTK